MQNALGAGGHEADVIGVVDEAAVGSEALYGVPEGVEQGRVEEDARGVDEDDGVLGGVECGGDIVECGFFSLGEAKCGDAVVAAGGGEKQCAVVAQNLVLGEDFLPKLYEEVEAGGLQLLGGAAEELARLVGEQIGALVVEEQEHELVELADGVGLEVCRSAECACILGVDAGDQRRGLTLGIESLERGEFVSLVGAEVHEALHEAGLAGAVGTDEGELTEVRHGRRLGTGYQGRQGEFTVHVRNAFCKGNKKLLTLRRGRTYPPL